MASIPDSVPVNDEVEQLLLNPEDHLEAITETADLFKALATPSRLKMLLVLTHGEPHHRAAQARHQYCATATQRKGRRVDGI